MLHAALARLRAFKCEQGLATLEFALVAPPFMALVVAIIQSIASQMYVASFDGSVQKFAEELRSGSSLLKDFSSESLIKAKLCPQLPPGFVCANVQVQLFVRTDCRTTSCWQNKYSDYAHGVRMPPTYVSSPATPTFTLGAAGDSQYLTVFYPLPMMSPIWDNASTVIFNGQPMHGLLSTAMWINDPSVGVF